MTSHEFQKHLNRLIEQYGKTAYSQSRAELIWREVKDFSPSWWERTVDQLLLTCRQAPLHAEFGEMISRERERLWQFQKKQHAMDAKDFFKSSYQDDDVKTLCETIVKRLTGGISDQEYTDFQKVLKNVSKSNPNPKARTQCNQCDDFGLIFHRDEENTEWVYRCYCSAGSTQPSSYPTIRYQHQKGA